MGIFFCLLDLSVHLRCSFSLVMLVALLWIHSNRSMSFFVLGTKKRWMQYSRWGLMRDGRITSINLLARTFCCSPGYAWFSGLQEHITSLCLIFHSPVSSSTSLQSCSQSIQPPNCTDGHLSPDRQLPQFFPYPEMESLHISRPPDYSGTQCPW